MNKQAHATTAIKSLSDDGDKIGGYLIVFGGPEQPDLQGEWFTPQTELGLELYPVRPIFYDHGTDRALKATMIGVIDTLRVDDVGVWCEGQLDRRNRYVKAVKQLIAKGALGWSSGSLPHLVTKSAEGEILRWPIIEGSVTPNPAEPQRTTVAALKSAYQRLGLDTTLFYPDSYLEMETDLNQENGMTEEVKNELAQTVNALADSVKSLRQEIARPAAVKRLPYGEAVPDANRVEVLRATKYSDLDPQDMAFLHEIMSSSVRGWNPGPAFYRELADKSFRAVNNHQLGYDAVKGLVERGYTKANELDTIGQAGFGSEWVADSWRSELWKKVRQDNVIAPLFPFVEMPTNPWEVPFESADPAVYYVPETTDAAQLIPTTASPITMSKTGSGKLQMNAKKLALRITWSSELNEDSLIPIIANYRQQAMRSMQNAIDNVLLNGDTATGANVNVNLIDSTPTAGTKYLAFDGLRKYALVTNAGQGINAAAAPSLVLFRQGRFKLAGAYATQPRNCAWIVDDNTYAAMLNMPEFLTMEKAGPLATAQTGQIGFMDGIAVFASAEMPLSNTAGKVSTTGTNNVKGQGIIVFKPNFMIGYRRQVQANVEFFPWADAYQLVVTVRLCMINFDAASAAELYNFTV